ncbi:MAG: hypothetical protein WBI40_04250 [Methylococcaceae bacterium]
MSSDSVEKNIDETLLAIKNYIDLNSISSVQNNQTIEKPPATIITTDSSNDGNIQFSLNSVAGLIETLSSMQKEITYLRNIIGV